MFYYLSSTSISIFQCFPQDSPLRQVGIETNMFSPNLGSYYALYSYLVSIESSFFLLAYLYLQELSIVLVSFPPNLSFLLCLLPFIGKGYTQRKGTLYIYLLSISLKQSFLFSSIEGSLGTLVPLPSQALYRECLAYYLNIPYNYFPFFFPSLVQGQLLDIQAKGGNICLLLEHLYQYTLIGSYNPSQGSILYYLQLLYLAFKPIINSFNFSLYLASEGYYQSYYYYIDISSFLE